MPYPESYSHPYGGDCRSCGEAFSLEMSPDRDSDFARWEGFCDKKCLVTFLRKDQG